MDWGIGVKKENKYKVPLFRTKRNCDELIEKLYNDDYLYFYKIAYSILKNDMDAKDAVHDSFLKAYKYADKISKMDCPQIKAYFVNIVKSVSINMKKRRDKTILSEFSEELIDGVESSEGADIVLERIFEKENLYTLLSELAVIEQNILEFKIIDEWTFKEISKIIGISEEAAKKRYQRILKKLQNRGKGGVGNDD